MIQISSSQLPGKINRYGDIIPINRPHFRIKQPSPPKKRHLRTIKNSYIWRAYWFLRPLHFWERKSQ